MIVDRLPACHSRQIWNEDAGVFFCRHPNVHVRDHLVTPEICRLCSLWRQDPPKRRRAAPTRIFVSRDSQCQHLGRLLHLETCESCRGNVQVKVFQCLHPEHETTTFNGCQNCVDYEPQLADSVSTWAVGVTTAPRRQSTIARSLESLEAAGWGNVRIFAEPGSTIPDERQHLPITWRESTLGPWSNWLLGLAELYHRHGDADAFMMVQDDVVLCRSARKYLESVLWPKQRTGVVSLYCPESYSRSERGFHAVECGDGAVGAVTFVFPPAAVRSLLSFAGVVNHHLRPGRAGKVHIDVAVGLWAAARKMDALYHSPSLAAHIGETSTIWQGAGGGARRRASDFIGEKVDAMSLL